MKTLMTFLILLLCNFSLHAQEQKVEIVADSLSKPFPTKTFDEMKFSCVAISCGIEIVQVPYDYCLPFKVYSIKNKNWVLQQDIYNALEAHVPSLRIANRNDLTTAPNFNIRGSDDTIVIVDGVRYDASIINSLNPSDIESIKVAPSVAATNYFLARPNF